MDNNNQNNKIEISGIVSSESRFSHKIYGEEFYNFDISVERLSGSADMIPVTISERLFNKDELTVGKEIKIDGQIRSYNSSSESRNRLVISVFAREIYYGEGNNENAVQLNGFICRKPVYRTTPMGREIADILIAVNRAYNKSDYIPCIAWGRNARFVKNVQVGQNIVISGRIQSRKYNKKLPDDTMEIRTAYELSVGKIMFDRCLTESAFTLDDKDEEDE